MFSGIFLQAFVYLIAAVIAVPLAKRMGLGSALGYIVAGVIIGPSLLGLVGAEGQDVMHFAEFGVVLMLFIVGLELEPAVLWRMRVPILGMGGSQVLLSALVIGAVAMAFGIEWQTAVAIGLSLALSSTAIVLQTLNEKGWMKTQPGRGGFSVLLFQDVAVIPILAILPFLAIPELATQAAGEAAAGAHGAEHVRPGWLQAVLVLAVVAGIVVAGRFLMRPVFRWIAETRSQELFMATALTLIVGITLAMEFVGLSPALGTFLAGVVLAESEFRHELEANIEPFKGLLHRFPAGRRAARADRRTDRCAHRPQVHRPADRRPDFRIQPGRQPDVRLPAGAGRGIRLSAVFFRDAEQRDQPGPCQPADPGRGHDHDRDTLVDHRLPKAHPAAFFRL